MDLRFTPEEVAFRDELRAVFLKTIPESIRERVARDEHLTKAEYVQAHKALHEKGLAVPHWPKAHGGKGWSPVQLYLYIEEMQLCCVPPPIAFNANMVGPVIYTFGNDDQKSRFLAKTAALDIWWAQGFSEPGAGSDLSGLKTKAEKRDGQWVINGQKAWATYAQHADWCFVLARTDPEAKKQSGISFFLVDMKTPGITLVPTRTIDGGHEVNEIFFEDVKVPAENLVGEVNKGWDYAKFLLANERMTIARVGVSKQRLERAKSLAKGRFKERIAHLEVQLKALEITQMRTMTSNAPYASLLKIKGSELQQATTELLMNIAGPLALEADEHATNAYFNNRKVSIYGGSNEIQRNIITKAFLGL